MYNTAFLTVPLLGCYAGVTGFLFAMACIQHSAAPPVKNLRNVNPYVGAALMDWGKYKIKGHIPLQPAPAAAADMPEDPVSAGTSSFGMSGVNAHMVVTRTTVKQSDAGLQVIPLGPRRGLSNHLSRCLSHAVCSH